jgi:hypothetical protein
MLILAPAVNVVRVKPDPLPMSIWPLAGVEERPVPPLATARVPVVPVDSGSPVALERFNADGVPRFGVVKVGLVENTTEPEPVDVVTPVPPPAIPRTPEELTLSARIERFLFWVIR